ncbi:hypothetical protein WA158_007990 [Blastocystis sp. Blastoise]
MCVLSLISCSIVFYVLFQKRRKLSLSQKLLNELNISLFGIAFCHLYGVIFDPEGFSCSFQGSLLQFFILNSALLSGCMAHHIHNLAPPRNPLMSTIYDCISYGIPLLSVIILLSANKIENAELWCWVTDDNWELTIFYIPLFLCILYDLYMCFSIKILLKKRNIPVDIGNQLYKKLLNYISLYSLLWSLALIHRLWEVFSTPPLPIYILHALSTSSLGFITSLFLTGHTYIPCIKRRPTDSAQEIALISMNEHTSLDTYDSPLKASLFILTFNLGEAKLTTSIFKDIPEHKDIYFFSFQECMDLSQTLSFLSGYINREGQYEVYTSYIGGTQKLLGYHGYVFTIVYLHKNLSSDVKTTTNSTLRTGKNVVLFTAGNKGASGLSIRLSGGQNLFFLGCHLSSDSSGKSNIGKRVEECHSILSSINIEHEDTEDWDTHYLHTATFIAGDMNYRCYYHYEDDYINDQIRAQLASLSHHQSSSTINTSINTTSKTHLLENDMSPSTEYASFAISPLSPDTFDPQSVINKQWGISQETQLMGLFYAITNAENEKQHINNNSYQKSYIERFDQLFYEMNKHNIYYTFKEGPIHFPPTFRYYKQSRGYCKDYTDYDAVSDSLTTHVKKGIRTPSYTDRIIYSVMPGLVKCIEQLSYDTDCSICFSDHKPVFSLFSLSFPPLHPAPLTVLHIQNIIYTPCTVDHQQFPQLFIRCPLPSQDLFWRQRTFHNLSEGLFSIHGSSSSDLIPTEYAYNYVNCSTTETNIYVKGIPAQHLHVGIKLTATNNKISIQGIFEVNQKATTYESITVAMSTGGQLKGYISLGAYTTTF